MALVFVLSRLIEWRWVSTKRFIWANRNNCRRRCKSRRHVADTSAIATTGWPLGPLLQQKDREEFTDLKSRVLRSKDYKPIVFHITKKAKQRVMNYKPFIPRENSTGTEGMLDIDSIRYISSADVDWFMERDKIIVPRDIETVEMLEQLKKTQIWNFASRSADIKKVGPGCCQNILIANARMILMDSILTTNQ